MVALFVPSLGLQYVAHRPGYGISLALPSSSLLTTSVMSNSIYAALVSLVS